MPDPTSLDVPTSVEHRARALYARLVAVAAPQPAPWHGVSEATFVDGCAEEITAAVEEATAAVRTELEAQLDELARQRDEAVAASEAAEEARRAAEEQCAQLDGALERARAKVEELGVALRATRAALREALARATQAGPVTGTADVWAQRLGALPPPSLEEIRALRAKSLGVLGALGAIGSEVTIVRLADVLLRPLDEPNAGAEEDDAPTL